MVIVKEDSTGRVIAYAELRLVDELGREQEKGIYVWIHDVWVHKSLRTHNKFNAILEGFINQGKHDFQWAEYIYWQRGKYGKRMSLYSKAKITRRVYGGFTEEARHISSTAAFAGANACSSTV
jgi:hypothetical protein